MRTGAGSSNINYNRYRCIRQCRTNHTRPRGSFSGADFLIGRFIIAATRLISLHQKRGQSVLQSLSDRINYAENPDKTQDRELISSYQCDPRTAAREFELSKAVYARRHGQRDGDVIAYQIRQSFKPGEITPEEANRVGYELAMRFTKGRHAFLVCTHTDRAHIHNHIIYNSTTLDCERKFQNFFMAAYAVRRISDHICLEHGLSIIHPLPPASRTRRTDYPHPASVRDQIRHDIDLVLQQNPGSLDELLRMLQERGYEIKRGKHIAVRGSGQKRFIRLQSLGEGYDEDGLRSSFDQGRQNQTVRTTIATRQHGKGRGEFSMLIDIQERIHQGKSAGYIRWAKRFNLKQMAQVLLYLQEHGIEDYDALVQRTDNASARYDQLAASIKSAETRLAEIATLKKHIFNYSRTKDVYSAYRASGYSKRFYEQHREELILHKAAKAAFNQLGGKVPRIKDLNAEYAAILDQKRRDYADYRTARADMRQLVMARKNIEILLEMDENEHERDQNQRQSSQQKR